MAHFRGANNTSFEKRESSSQNYSASSSSNTSSTLTRGYQAAQGGVMDNFGGVRYAAEPPVQYQPQQQPQYQQLPPPQQQGTPQGYRQESPPPQQQPVPIERAPPAPAAAKPKTSFKKNNVRIVGGKLFHVADDVEGPLSIQFIGEHPDGGNRPYHVAKSTYPPPEKPRNATSAGGQRFHFI